MPTVPGQQPDPFNTRVKGKEQSRLPQDTTGLHPGQQAQALRPSQAELLMAAALMHQDGMFQNPPEKP